MATNVNYIKGRLSSFPKEYLDARKEMLIRDWIPLVKGDYKGLLEVIGNCPKVDTPKDIMDELWTEIISVCPTLEDFWNIVYLVDENHQKTFYLKGISLCETDLDIDDIQSCFDDEEKEDKDLIQAIQTRRDEILPA